MRYICRTLTCGGFRFFKSKQDFHILYIPVAYKIQALKKKNKIAVFCVMAEKYPLNVKPSSMGITYSNVTVLQIKNKKQISLPVEN